MKARWKILLGFIGLVAVILIVAVAYHFQLKAAVNRYRAELVASGEPLELAQVMPPTVPGERNDAAWFTNAVALLNPNDSVLTSNRPPMMRLVAFGKAMVGWMQPDIRELGENGATNSWADITAALNQDQLALAKLHQLPPQPLFDFQINYAAGFEKMNFSPLGASKKSGERLAASALNNLRSGNAIAAGSDIQAILAVDQGFLNDRTAIAELVRQAVAQIAVAATWEWLQATNIPDEQLAELQQGWMHLDFIASCENSLLLERAVEGIDISEMRRSNLKNYFEDLDKLADEGVFVPDRSLVAGVRVKCKTFLWHYWWSYADELRYLQGMQCALAAPRSVRTNYCLLEADDASKSQIEKLTIKTDAAAPFWMSDPARADFHYLASSSVIILSGVFNKTMKVEAAKQLVITAIALKRFQQKYARLPGRLSDLAPEFFATVPLDPIDGQPLRYHLNSDGTWALYSIGQNGKDDGGNPALEAGVVSATFQWQNRHALDWVWPQPATEAEVNYFYDHPPK